MRNTDPGDSKTQIGRGESWTHAVVTGFSLHTGQGFGERERKREREKKSAVATKARPRGGGGREFNEELKPTKGEMDRARDGHKKNSFNERPTLI